MMKLYYGSASPYVRKVMVVAIETGLGDRLQLEKLGLLSPAHPEPRLATVNPLAKIPTLVAEDNSPIFDSSVICDYLDSLHGGPKLIPAGAGRWAALTRAAAADGLLEAAMTVRAEMARDTTAQSAEWIVGHRGKVSRCLDFFEAHVARSGVPEGLAGACPIDIGDIACACALGWLDFRMPDDDWRADRHVLARWFAEIAERPSMCQTKPANPPT